MENQVKLSCFWRYYCSYSNVYFIKISPDLTLKQPLNTITLKEFLLDKTQSDDRSRLCLTARFEHPKVFVTYDTLGFIGLNVRRKVLEMPVEKIDPDQGLLITRA